MSLPSTEPSLMWGMSGRHRQAQAQAWEAQTWEAQAWEAPAWEALATGRGRLGPVASAAQVRSSRLEEGATAHPAEADQRPQAPTTKASLGWT